MRRGSLTLPEPTAEAAPTQSMPAPAEPLRTEFSFLLPRGYVDASGIVHRHGVMRLATARTSWCPCATTGCGKTRRT